MDSTLSTASKDALMSAAHKSSDDCDHPRFRWSPVYWDSARCGEILWPEKYEKRNGIVNG
jgi:hypothetical protein